MEHALVKEKTSNCHLSFVSVRMQGTREENGLKVRTEEADDTSIWTQVLGWKELL